MIKSFLILISLSIFLYSSQQIVLVVSNDFNTSTAKMECFDGDKKVLNTIDVNIGKNGLGWGLGEIQLQQKKDDSIKHEGDKKAPIGIFKLSSIFGYENKINSNMPYLHATKSLICVDDSTSNEYNRIINIPKNKPKSFEYMRRDDLQYELGIVVEHNKDAIPQRGSCIFMHVQKAKDAPTAGCTSMSYDDIKNVVMWLDESKNPILIQIPKSSSKEILKLYPQLRDSTLLK